MVADPSDLTPSKIAAVPHIERRLGGRQYPAAEAETEALVCEFTSLLRLRPDGIGEYGLARNFCIPRSRRKSEVKDARYKKVQQTSYLHSEFQNDNLPTR
jgi:hypothetical protein